MSKWEERSLIEKWGALAAALTGSVTLVFLLFPSLRPELPRTPPAPSTTPVSTPAEPRSTTGSVIASEPRTLEASREFVLGRWQAEQASGEESGVAVFDYNEDGTFTGTVTNFRGSTGSKTPIAGRWEMKRLSPDRFWLRMAAPNYTYEGTFRVVDQDHVHNIDNNYISVRIK